MKQFKSSFLPFIVVSLCSVHLCQSIFFSGGDLIPGNLGDSRFVNLILEHNFQSVIGKEELPSPSQFFPYKYTLFYASNLFGTTPIYLIPRTMGFSMETSFQIWFFLVESLNAIAFLFLLKTFKVHRAIGFPLAFAAVSSSAFVFKVGHPQLLAIFPFFFSLVFLVKFLRKPNFSSFTGFVAFYVFQHYCDIYQGFFASLILLTLLIFYFTLSDKRKTFEVWAFLKVHKIQLSVLAMVLFGLLFVLYFPYYLTTRSYGTRGMQELVDLAPRLSAWFTASPYSMLYSGLNFLDGEANPYSKHLFSGFACYVILVCGFTVFLKQRKEIKFELCFCLSLCISTIFLIIIMTTWKEPDFNIWLWLSGKIEPLRAFRAFARIGYLLFAIQVLAAAIILNHFNERYRKKRTVFIAVVSVSCICTIECISFGQAERKNGFIHYEKSHAQERVLGLHKSLDTNKSYDTIVFCPGTTLHPWSVHLDAWNLALSTGIPCLNGYSGQAPRSHVKFLASPTRVNAEELVESLNLDKSKVAFIESWSAEMEQEYPVIRYQLDEKITISTKSRQVEGSVGERLRIKVKLNNPTPKSIPCKLLNFHPSYRLYDLNSSLVEGYEPPRSPIDELSANSENNHELILQLPHKPGRYIIKTSFVHEHVDWMIDLQPSIFGKIDLIVGAN
jgi:hypothetical protein